MDPAIIIVVVTILISVIAFQDQRLIDRLILSPYMVVHYQQWYRVITHAFIHADWMHLLFNMIALWSFGEAVLTYFGYISQTPDLHFYMMYFAATLISSVHDLVKHKDDPGYLSLGASGAVSAVVFSAIFFNPWGTVLIFFIPCPGILFGVIYLLYSSFMWKRGGDRINHTAHFYGSVFGFIYPMLMNPQAIQIFVHELIHPKFF